MAHRYARPAFLFPLQPSKTNTASPSFYFLKDMIFCIVIL